jgi:acetyl esterase/lipase
MKSRKTDSQIACKANLMQTWPGWRFIACLIILGVTTVNAQELPSYIERPSDAAGIFAIYPGTGAPPGSENATWREQTMQASLSSGRLRIVRNVVIPTITMFKPPVGKANGTSLIIAPGGAFRLLAIDKEGYDMARWLTQHGITAFVLKYRLTKTPEDEEEMRAYLRNLINVLPRQSRDDIRPPVGDAPSEAARLLAEEDGRQAIRYVRQRAAEWGLDPQRIGIAGFSAGGGVAVAAAVEHDAQSRPDFVVGVYPGVRKTTPVPADAPPMFLAITDDDVLVAPLSVARLYEEWRKANKPVELHIFTKGGHGFGMLKQNQPSDAWLDLLRNWLDALGFLTPSRK